MARERVEPAGELQAAGAQRGLRVERPRGECARRGGVSDEGEVRVRGLAELHVHATVIEFDEVPQLLRPVAPHDLLHDQRHSRGGRLKLLRGGSGPVESRNPFRGQKLGHRADRSEPLAVIRCATRTRITAGA